MPVLSKAKWEKFAQGLAKGKTIDQAYIDAGYSENRSNAARLNTKDAVRARVTELQTKIADIVVKETALTKEWIINMLVENAQRSMRVIAVVDRDGEPTGEYKYEGSVANRALELLGKEKGMFIERREVGDPGAFDGLTDDDLHASIAQTRAELDGKMPGETEH